MQIIEFNHHDISHIFIFPYSLFTIHLFRQLTFFKGKSKSRSIFQSAFYMYFLFVRLDDMFDNR